jgi:hypothetical protein
MVADTDLIGLILFAFIRACQPTCPPELQRRRKPWRRLVIRGKIIPPPLLIRPSRRFASSFICVHLRSSVVKLPSVKCSNRQLRPVASGGGSGEVGWKMRDH